MHNVVETLNNYYDVNVALCREKKLPYENHLGSSSTAIHSVIDYTRTLCHPP